MQCNFQEGNLVSHMVSRSVVEHMNGAFLASEIRISSLMDGTETILFLKQQQNMVMKMSILFMTRGYWRSLINVNKR